MKNSKGLIYRFLRNQSHITLSAPGKDGSPEGITVNYFVDGDQLYVYITSEDYTKYPNQLADTEIAGVVSADYKTLQLVAHCKRLTDKRASVIQNLVNKTDPNARYFFTTSTKFYHILPSILRYQDYSKRPVENAFYEVDAATAKLQDF